MYRDSPVKVSLFFKFGKENGDASKGHIGENG